MAAVEEEVVVLFVLLILIFIKELEEMRRKEPQPLGCLFQELLERLVGVKAAVLVTVAVAAAVVQK